MSIGQPFNVLYDQIRLHAKRVSVPAMDIALRRTARDLCYRTTIRRESIEINVKATVVNYPLFTTNTDEEPVDIEAVQYNVPGQINPVPLVPYSPEQVASPGFNNTYPSWYYLDTPYVAGSSTINTQVVIGPDASVTQDVTNGLFVRVILQPKQSATTLDPALLQRCDRSIVEGALAWLLGMNSEPWTNLPEAEKFRQLYERGIIKAKTAAELGFQKWNIDTAMHRF